MKAHRGSDARSVVIVHGGGKEIDAALKAAGIEKRQVDGLRITDEPTLDVVVSVLAGAVNTRFVAALTAAGVRGGRADRRRRRVRACRAGAAAPYRRRAAGGPGARRHAERRDADMRVLTTLLGDRVRPGRRVHRRSAVTGGCSTSTPTRWPGIWRRGSARGGWSIAGTTPACSTSDGATVPLLEPAADRAARSASGTATAGMIAKLRACEHALARRRGRCRDRGWPERAALERRARRGAADGDAMPAGRSACATTAR